MLTGLSSAAAGMAAQRQRIDAVSNDLANANTTGYKRVRVAFRDLVYQDAPRAAAPGVRIGAGVAAATVGRAFEQGTLQTTGRPLDVALQGPGFLQVRLPDGRTGLTRDGNLQFDARGRLATSRGALVQPAVTLPAGVDPARVTIDREGALRAGERVVGRLQVVGVRAPQNLLPVGDNAFVATPESGAPARAPGTVVHGGALEASNVDVAEAMVGLIESQRAFELASRAIKTADQMMGTANEVKR